MKKRLEEVEDNFHRDLDALKPHGTSSQDQIEIAERKHNNPDENLMETMRWIESIQESNMIELIKQLTAESEKAVERNKRTVIPTVGPAVDSISESLTSPSLTPPLKSTSSSIREQLPDVLTLTGRSSRMNALPTGSSTGKNICATGAELLPAGSLRTRARTSGGKRMSNTDASDAELCI
jgi:hypothetical protein